MQQPVTPDEDVLEADVRGRGGVEAELLLLAGHLDLAAVEEEGADAARSGLVRVGAGEDEERAGVAAVRDPLLGAGQPPAVAVGHRGRAQGAGIRARLGLGQRERAEHLAGSELGDEPLLLLLAAEGEDRQRDGARVHGDGDADAGIRARELLEHEDVREEVRSRAPELLGHADAHQPELAQLGEQLAREGVLAVPGRRVRGDLGLGHLPRKRLDRALLGGQREVHRARV